MILQLPYRNTQLGFCFLDKILPLITGVGVDSFNALNRFPTC